MSVKDCCDFLLMTNFFSSFSKDCLLIKMDWTNQSAEIVAIDCNSDDAYYSFICEKITPLDDRSEYSLII